jgi:hypothetical protein
MTRRSALLALSAALVGGASAADTIRLADGKSIQNVQVLSEGLKEVAYKEGRNDKTVPSESVLAVEYEKRPPQFDDAERFLIEEDRESAVDVLEAMLAKPELAKSFKWAPAHVAWRVVEVRQSAVDLEGVKSSAGRLIQSFPESRFVPHAYLAKAAAELQTGQAAQAQKTLSELSGLVSAQSLPKRWQLECRLAQAQADDKLKPESRRNEYERVMGEAAGLGTVQAGALALIGESHLAEAAGNLASAKDARSKAKTAFEKVVALEEAGRDALADAHAGLGECLFLQGADADDKTLLTEAALHCLRVITLYRDQGRTVARSYYFAMRCFDLLPDARRKAEMKRELLAQYPSTTWAAEAKKY